MFKEPQAPANKINKNLQETQRPTSRPSLDSFTGLNLEKKGEFINSLIEAAQKRPFSSPITEKSESHGEELNDPFFEEVYYFFKKPNTFPPEIAGKIQLLLDILEMKKPDTRLLHDFVTTARENRENVDYKELLHLNLETKDIGVDFAEPLADEDAMLDLCKENYRQLFSENPIAFKLLVSDFEKELPDLKNQRVYVLRYKGEIVAFCRFKPMADGVVYAGSLNVDKKIQQISIGSFFLKEVLDQELRKSRAIQAITRVENPANKKYQDLGFEFSKETFEKNGIAYYNIILKSPSY